MLLPPKPGSPLHSRIQESTTSQPLGGTSTFPTSDDFWTNIELDSLIPDSELALKRKWRISVEQLAALREAAHLFEGTHNFHNFTVGREVGDRANMRYMKSIEVANRPLSRLV